MPPARSARIPRPAVPASDLRLVPSPWTFRAQHLVPVPSAWNFCAHYPRCLVGITDGEGVEQAWAEQAPPYGRRQFPAGQRHPDLEDTFSVVAMIARVWHIPSPRLLLPRLKRARADDDEPLPRNKMIKP
ncbi:hypothetical protein C8R46DRAFT_1214026 [Mycena filopes]|nr:hypothetical protein C8R46DRAFT_1214026 [Mycena filopes]